MTQLKVSVICHASLTQTRRDFQNEAAWVAARYSTPDRGAEYCDERVCVFVCPRSYLHNYMSDLHQIFVHDTPGRGS